MTTSAPTKAEIQMDEEAEAARLEGIAKISSSGLKAVRRLHKIKALEAQLSAEKDELRAELEAEMKSEGANALAFKGVVAVAVERTTTSKTDSKKLFADYPQLLSIYVTKNPDASRFSLKALV